MAARAPYQPRQTICNAPYRDMPACRIWEPLSARDSSPYQPYEYAGHIDMALETTTPYDPSHMGDMTSSRDDYPFSERLLDAAVWAVHTTLTTMLAGTVAWICR